jgi:hypothetical protein
MSSATYNNKTTLPADTNPFWFFFSLPSSAAVPCASLRLYATTSNKKPRHHLLDESNAADLSKVDPILDFSDDKPTTLDQPKTFPFNRPPEVVLNTVTDIVDTPLDRLEQMRLLKKALVVKRVVNMNGKGKQPSMYALVVVGNGNGLAGYGEGKDEEASRAVRKATNRAIKNMRYFERYDERTIAMDVSHKFHATTIHLRSRPPGKVQRNAAQAVYIWLSSTLIIILLKYCAYQALVTDPIIISTKSAAVLVSMI